MKLLGYFYRDICSTDPSPEAPAASAALLACLALIALDHTLALAQAPRLERH
jgi:hypothetical protein